MIYKFHFIVRSGRGRGYDIHYFFSLQKLRGAGYNLIVVDEVNFLPLKIFYELVPMCQEENTKMMLATSDRPDSDTRDYINIDSLRCEAIPSVRWTYFCPNHQRSVKGKATRCLCNLFKTPPHITLTPVMNEVVRAFEAAAGGSGNLSLAAELGLEIECEYDEGSTNQQFLFGKSSGPIRLARKEAIDYFVSPFNPRELVSISDTVWVYIDPGLFNSETCAFNGHAYVAENETEDESVILAAENFKSGEISEAVESCQANAIVCAVTLDALFRLHKNLKRAIVVVESNTMDPHPVIELFKEEREKSAVLPDRKCLFYMERLKSRKPPLPPLIRAGYRLGKSKLSAMIKFYAQFNEKRVRASPALFSQTMLAKSQSAIYEIKDQLENVKAFRDTHNSAKVSGKTKGKNDDLAVAVAMAVNFSRDHRKKSLPLNWEYYDCDHGELPPSIRDQTMQ